jgi:hypothetical protein
MGHVGTRRDTSGHVSVPQNGGLTEPYFTMGQMGQIYSNISIILIYIQVT